MKKIILSAWLLMLSIAAMAQTIIVVDKDGNSVPYDQSKVTSIEFQATPPGFTVNQQNGSVQYLSENVRSLQGNPNYVFVYPGVVNAGADGENLTVQVKTNVEFDVASSVSWITFDADAKDGQRYVMVAMNPTTDERTGMVTLTSKDGALASTLTVVQAGKEDSRYIDIDWQTTTLDSYDDETGVAVLTFAGDVPVMGEYDVVLLPNEIGNLFIRVIETVEKVEGKTVTLKTMEGDMGNLFRDQEFTLELGDDGSAGARCMDGGSAAVIRPEKVEVFEDGKYVEIYNAVMSRGYRAPDTQDLSFDFDGSGKTLWSQGDQGSLKLEKYKLAMKMKGTIAYKFKKEPWYKVWKSDVTLAQVTIAGDWESETVYHVTSNTAGQINVKPSGLFTDDPVMQANIIQRRYTFMVGNIPVQVVLGGNMKYCCGVKLTGQADIKGGLKLGKHFRYGMTLDTQRAQPDTYIFEDAIDRSKTSLVYPEMNAGTADYKNSSAYGYASVYPELNINFYGNGVRASFQACEWLHALSSSWEPEPTDAPGYLARRARMDRFRNVHMVMTNIPNTIFELNEVYGDSFTTDVDEDSEALIKIPENYQIESPEELETCLMENDEMEVKMKAFHYDRVSGEQIPTAGVLMEVEVEDGEGNNKMLKYTDDDGCVSLKFKKGNKREETLITRLFLKNKSGSDAVNEGKRVVKLLSHEITCETPEQEVEKGTENVPVIFILNRTEGYTTTALAHQRVEFTATGGTVSPRYGTTDKEGKVTAFFTPEEGATEGNVLAITTVEGNKVTWEGRANGKITVKDGGGTSEPCDVDDPDLQKANQLDNAYVVKNTKTGETMTRSYNPKYSEWTKTADFLNFQLNDEEEDEEGNPNTKGMLYGHIPLTMRGVILMLTGQQFENTPGAKVGFGLYDGLYVSSDFMCATGDNGSMTTVGEIKPDGKSKILIRQPCNQTAPNTARRAPGDEQEEEYTDEYELLYYLVFTTQAWNPETKQSEEVELEVYGKGTMVMHVPTITYFVLSNDKDWVRVGESTKVTVERYDEYGAVWDWNDVQIIGQSSKQTEAKNGTDNGFFTWDAATQTLTSVKSNDNDDVWVYLGLKSNPGVMAPVQVATGEGWKYTTIGTSVEEITCQAPSYPSFSMTWTPKDSDDERFNFNSVELDPDSNPDGYFQFPAMPYANQGWPLHVNNNCPPGEYNVKIRLKSDYSVNCTLKVTVTK